MEDFKSKLIQYKRGELKDISGFIRDIVYNIQDYQERDDLLIEIIIDSLKEIYPEYIMEGTVYHGMHSYHKSLDTHLNTYKGYTSFTIKKEVASIFTKHNDTWPPKHYGILEQRGKFYSFYKWSEDQVNKHNLDIDLAKEFEVFAKLDNYKIVKTNELIENNKVITEDIMGIFDDNFKGRLIEREMKEQRKLRDESIGEARNIYNKYKDIIEESEIAKHAQELESNVSKLIAEAEEKELNKTQKSKKLDLFGK